MASRVIHFEIHAEDPAAAAKWYGDLFGWRTQDVLGGEYFLVVSGDGLGIDGAIARRRGPAAAAGAPINAFVCTIGTDDIDAHWTKAKAAGATDALPKMAIPGVGWQAYLHDPFGNIFGLHEPDAGAK